MCGTHSGELYSWFQTVPALTTVQSDCTGHGGCFPGKDCAANPSTDLMGALSQTLHSHRTSAHLFTVMSWTAFGFQFLLPFL